MKRFCEIIVMVMLIGILTLSLSTCGHQGPQVGFVQQREFVPAHDNYVPAIIMPGHESCYTVNKSERCSYTPGFMIPGHTDHIHDAWRVYLVNGKHKGWRSVDQATYDACPMNDFCDTTIKR